MSTQNTVTTRKAREKFAKAHAGAKPLPAVTKIGFGSGGHDVGGNPTPPSDTATSVPGEFLRKNITSTNYPVTTTLQIIGTLDFSEGNGQLVSACGLYDAEGDLVALKHFRPKPKDEEGKLIIEWDEQF